MAATLGHGPARVFLRASLPLAWRAILAGMLLCWLRAFGEFGATVMVAYHPYSLPVYTYVAFGSEGLPAMIPVLVPTLGVALLVMLAAADSRRPEGAARRPRPKRQHWRPPGRPPCPHRSQRHRRVSPSTARWRVSPSMFRVTPPRDASRCSAPRAPASRSRSRALAGLDHHPGDRLWLGGRDLSVLRPEQRGIAYVPQSYGLFPHLTTARQLSFAADADADAGRARYWLNRMGLDGLEQRLPEALSLGQQQRVAIARAFSRPAASLLLLDEPFSALDAPLRAQLRQELRQLQEEVAVTTILVTHDPEEAFFLADTLIVLQAGRVLQSGPVNARLRPPGRCDRRADTGRRDDRRRHRYRQGRDRDRRRPGDHGRRAAAHARQSRRLVRQAGTAEPGRDRRLPGDGAGRGAARRRPAGLAHPPRRDGAARDAGG